MDQQDRTSELQSVVNFHGHICPGLIIGYRAAKLAAKKLELERDVDEELVAVVENDACGVDAIQVMLGCSIGKGNLIFRDYGKQAFSVFRRRDGQGVRLVFKDPITGNDPAFNVLRKKVMAGKGTAEEKDQVQAHMQRRIQDILSAADEEVFEVKQPSFAIPERARIFDSYRCEACGENTMEPRLRLVNGKMFCMDCAQPYHRGW